MGQAEFPALVFPPVADGLGPLPLFLRLLCLLGSLEVPGDRLAGDDAIIDESVELGVVDFEREAAAWGERYTI
jgi:hypothetical protein